MTEAEFKNISFLACMLCLALVHPVLAFIAAALIWVVCA